MLNVRIKLCVFIINVAIKCLPKDWQTKVALQNLLKTNIIKGIDYE